MNKVCTKRFFTLIEALIALLIVSALSGLLFYTPLRVQKAQAKELKKIELSILTENYYCEILEKILSEEIPAKVFVESTLKKPAYQETKEGKNYQLEATILTLQKAASKTNKTLVLIAIDIAGKTSQTTTITRYEECLCVEN